MNALGTFDANLTTNFSFVPGVRTDYRINHGDAPRPNMPCRGVVIATMDSDNDDNDKDSSAFSLSRWAGIGRRGHRRQHQQEQQLKRQRKRRWWLPWNMMEQQQPPLRLLVIGDSLAAGVGMTESSIPALPESIAQALSKANDGRAVYWTCVGFPGNSSSELIQQIHHLEDIMPPPLLSRLREWQGQRARRAKQRINETRSKLRYWWEEHRRPVQIDNDDDEVQKNPVGRWWRRARLGAERDWTNFRRVFEHDNEHQQLEQKVTTMVKRNAFEPSFVNQFDIAVVLTGLNDLKDSFLPFMMSEQRANKLQEARDDNNNNAAEQEDGLKGELLRVVRALKSKMKISLPGDNKGDDEKTSTRFEGSGNEKITATSSSAASRADSKLRYTKPNDQEQQGPLVVFPAMPFTPTSLSQVAPLGWFLGPLIRGMDRNKKVLAELYPELVVYIDPPDAQFFEDAAAKRGPFWKDLQKDRVLLKLRGIAPHVRERVEDLMRKHYASWVIDASDEDDLYLLEADDVLPLSEQFYNRHPGEGMVSADGIHPNDQGYDLWGRFIARAIMEHYETQFETRWYEKRRRWRGVPESLL